jgi:hypothetical protein
MTVPDYLTEAGTILMAAAQSNRKREAAMTEAGVREDWAGRRELRAEALQIADGLTRLAAISAGLTPCCCHAQPEQETT